MSLVFVVESEEALSSGLAWCRTFAQQTSSGIHAAIIGMDRKVLLALTKRSMSESFQSDTLKYSVQAVGNDPDALLEFVRSVGGRTLLVPHCADGNDYERTVFEKSPIQTFWLRAAAAPPLSTESISIAVPAGSVLATSISQQLLDLIPDQVICDSKSNDLSCDELLARLQNSVGENPGRLLLFGINDTSKSNTAYTAARKLIEENGQLSVALVRGGESLSESFGSRVKLWFARVAPPMERQERMALANDLEMGSKPNLEFLGMISAASMLAAFGLLQDSAAVIIGAMLIAPLMTPILGAGMSLAHGNRPLFKASLLTITLGFFGALVSSMLFGWLVWLLRPEEADHIKWVTGEMWARCRPSPLDFCVGLVGGLAASYARTRSHLSAALAGAAIAAALVPPLATAGLQLSFGLFGRHSNGFLVIGPLLLVTINVLTIMIGSSFMLWARGMRRDPNTSKKEKWTVRVVAVLLVLTVLVLVASLDLEMIFPH